MDQICKPVGWYTYPRLVSAIDIELFDYLYQHNYKGIRGKFGDKVKQITIESIKAYGEFTDYSIKLPEKYWEDAIDS